MGDLKTGAGMWRIAVMATLHCLLGCAIGEVAGMVISTGLRLGAGPAVGLSVVLAFGFGYSLSLAPLMRGGLPFRRAFKLALAADTVSITSMELVDNAVVLAIPAALAAGLGTGLFWGSLALSLVVAFGVTVPVNWWLIRRGKGHAVMHGRH
jgi:hypothetical protein